MRKLSSRIEIGSYAFDYLNDFSTKASWDDEITSCNIRIPKRIKLQEKNITSDIFKVGDEVKVYLGYDDNLKLVFQGYVWRVIPNENIEIECQDGMYLLRRKTVQASWKAGKVKTIIEELCEGTDIDFVCEDIEIGKLRTKNNPTALKVLQELKSKYGVFSFFKNGKLYVGLAYELAEVQDKTYVFDLQKNVVSHSLKMRDAEDYPLQIKAISIQKGGGEVVEYFGEEGGDTKTVYAYNMSKTDLKAFAEREHERLNYTGLEGTITTFGEPFVYHGDKVVIKDNLTTERNGKYIVQSVRRTFGMSGYRQTITLNKKIIE